MTGCAAATHGVPGFYDTHLNLPTLPQALRDAGYHTALAGKLHLWPMRKRFGFEEMMLSDGPGASPAEGDSDYLRFLRESGVSALPGARQQMAHGIAGESSFVRPWHLDERLHVANWTADMAIRAIERRDPARPLFLNVSFFHPHPPTTPPPVYYERYLRLLEEHPEVAEPIVAEWSRVFDTPQRGLKWNAARQSLPPAQQRQLVAAYLGAINHIDDQVQRVMEVWDRSLGLNNTLIVCTSDHGEMLGDHQWMRKRLPWEMSARVPLLVRPPGTRADAGTGPGGGRVCGVLAGLRDVMPTILDACGVEPTGAMDGRSLLGLARGEGVMGWRSELHGETSDTNGAAFGWTTGMQYLVRDTEGERWKLCWFPGLGLLQGFNLTDDPAERSPVDVDGSPPLQAMKRRLIDILQGRPEGFVRDGELVKLDGPTSPWLPGYERSVYTP